MNLRHDVVLVVWVLVVDVSRGARMDPIRPFALFYFLARQKIIGYDTFYIIWSSRVTHSRRVCSTNQ